ncbi:CHAD domain-containing protein [Nocardia sp. GAS34]|uniref:CHAD domain-containing protein n=1 Tax=unclassified Nocardia TaxID=2637762 RepID=UPI003D23AEA2
MVAAAGSALIDALGDDVDRLLRAEPEVREDRPDSVHAMRVATRRLRSLLRSYRRLLEPGPVGEIRDELRWLAALLGTARDAEVRADRFEALLADVPDAEGAAAQRRTIRRLVRTERAHYSAAHRVLLRELDGPRYAQLVETLRKLRRRPPLRRRRAEAEATRAFGSVLRNDFRELSGLVGDEIALRANPAVTAAQRIEHLHDIRKSAKRLRYSAEAAARVLGDPATELAERAKNLQTVLGDHRDAIEAMETIRTTAARTRTTDTSPFDRIYQSEADAARKALEQYAPATEFIRLRYDSL